MKYTYRTHFQSPKADNKAAALEFRNRVRAAGFAAELDDKDPTVVDHEAPDEVHDPLIDEIENGK